MDVSVIIVTYNSEDCIAAAIQSVQVQTGPSWEIIVVDNASRDATVSVTRALPGTVQILANSENVGFGKANNLGAAMCEGRFLYCLNPDAQLTSPQDLARLVRALDEHPRWGLAGTQILSPSGERESPPAFDYPDQRRVRRDFSKLPGRIAWVLGASMVIRRDAFTHLGGFDPDFFLHSEETDLCLRMRELGYEIGLIEDVAIRHIGGASEDQSDPYGQWERRMRGLQVFRQKHYMPTEVRDLTRRDWLRASWRTGLNGVLAALQPVGSRAWAKHRRYRAIRDVTKEYLTASPESKG